MRKTVIGALTVALSVPFALLGDRIVSAAPAWVWALLATTVALGGFVIVILSEPVFKRLAPLTGRHKVSTVALVFLVGGTVATIAWLTMLRLESGGSQHESIEAPSAKAPILDIVLTQASSGNSSGLTYFTPSSWYRLFTNVTIVNRGSDDTVSFEWRIETAPGVTNHLAPTTQPPPEIILPPGTRLFGVERVVTGAPLTGSLLFELPRHQIPAVPSPVPGDPPLNLPNTRNSRIVVKSELSGLEQAFTDSFLFRIKQ